MKRTERTENLLGSISGLLDGVSKEPPVEIPGSINFGDGPGAGLISEVYRLTLSKLRAVQAGEYDVSRILEISPHDRPKGGLSVIGAKCIVAAVLANKYDFSVPPEDRDMATYWHEGCPTVPVGWDSGHETLFFYKDTKLPYKNPDDNVSVALEKLAKDNPLFVKTDSGYEGRWHTLIALRADLEPDSEYYNEPEGLERMVVRDMLKIAPEYIAWRRSRS